MRREQEHVDDHLRKLHDSPSDADIDDEELGDTALEQLADQAVHAVTTLMHDRPAKQRLSQRGAPSGTRSYPGPKAGGPFVLAQATLDGQSVLGWYAT